MQPTLKPACPNFSSGPCAKRPGYQLDQLDTTTLGRSHRSNVGKQALAQAIEQTKALLEIPDDYRVGIVPASDTGAMEMAMWSMLGARDVDVFAWESFGSGWLSDINNELKLNAKGHVADYGKLPDFSQANPNNDTVFTWNGTTSGVKVPNADWISDTRTGLSFCDATSAVFAMPMPWSKLDVTTFSWQKVLGGEGGHGVIILSPRAVQRLCEFSPDRPIPKIFRMAKNNKLIEGIFSGATINTPSMLAVADYLDALNWVQQIGGVSASITKSENNLKVIESFVESHDWINFLAQEIEERSNTSVCLVLDLNADQIKTMVSLLAQQQVAFDIGAYRDAPSGLRIWCGATVEQADLEALMPWVKWAYHQVK
ncbi:phosphoserine transaminase [Alginatibacterium sediminis]|uniref:phosphoserine transaminase n=1 Tax=Alginatibacterium sediminis TaxID=2164068 RepID=A0A420EDI5_9ALTE|nr:phosphoserine transaminase [Alginatibacterium sediminis]RKF18714.1 phosphoserine transaminase [Alginatibacterium sediminis]